MTSQIPKRTDEYSDANMIVSTRTVCLESLASSLPSLSGGS